MRILSVTWGFPRHDQPFVATKLLALAAMGHRVRVLCAPGDRGLRVPFNGSTSSALVRRPVLREEDSDAVTRLLPLLASAVARDPGFVRRAVGSVDGVPGSSRARLAASLPFAGERPDVVHFEFANWATNFVDALPLLPWPKLVTCHGSDVRLEPLHDARLRQNLRRLFGGIDRVVAVSDELGANAVRLGADPARVVVIPMGIDTSFFTRPEPWPRTQPIPPLRLASVGRLHWVKGYEYALHALRLLRDRGQDVIYTIAGRDAGAEAAVRLAVRDLGLADAVRVVPGLPPTGVRNLLAGSDLFVLPSVSEGLSVAALEAMAMELPVVATRVGGMPEAVTHGRHGLLVPPRDPAALANAIECLLADPGRRRRMGSAGAVHVRRNFDARRQAERLTALYGDLLTSG